MADSRWVSTTGDLNAAASYAPSGVPAINDSVYFDGTSDKDVSLNLTAFSATFKTKIWLQQDYDGNIGADGNPLTVPVKYLIHHGTGTLFHSFQWDSINDTYVVIDSPNMQLAYQLVGATNNTLDLFFVNGRSILKQNGYVRSLTIGSRFGLNAPIVDIETGTGPSTFYRQSSGLVTTKVSLGTSGVAPIIDGGYLKYDSSGTQAWNSLFIAGGLVEYNGTGTLVDCVVSTGTLDMTRDSRAKTISKLTIMPGGNFLTHANVTVTKLIDLRNKVPVLP